MKAAGIAVIVVVALSNAFVVDPANASPTCRRAISHSVGSTCQQDLEWRYDNQRLAFIREGVSTRDGRPASSGVRFDWERRERCDARGATCGAAALTCADGTRRGYRYAVYGYRLDERRNRVPGPAEVVTTECVYPETVVPASQVQALAAREVRKRVGRPAITTSPPGGRTLVNIPTLYSTTRYGPVRLRVTAPVPGAITAVPEWVWTFPDTSRAFGPGIAYNPAISPLRNPDAYVNTIYDSPGPKSVTLILTWRVTFALQSVQDVDLAPITFTSTATTTAVTATNRLLTQPRP